MPTRSELDLLLTFDVDFVDHVAGELRDEMEAALRFVWPLFEAHPQWRTTWFIRIDADMEARFGQADHIFRVYAEPLAQLRAAGHEIGWHLHSYQIVNAEPRQNVEVESVAAELRRFAPLAAAHGLTAVRMGWGFHTNETMSALSDLGFRIDSSAIPRPRYAWETGARDWSGTGQAPYRPSIADYRRSGTPSRDILEIPISTGAIAAPYDTEPVIRYVNFAYRPEVLAAALNAMSAERDQLVSITHPFELAPGSRHDLLAYHPSALATNVRNLQESCAAHGRTLRFCTVSELSGSIGKAS